MERGTSAMTTKEHNQILMKRVSELEQENRKLHETVTYLTGKLFGSSSEKTSALQIDGQLSLFNEIETTTEPEQQEPAIEEVTGTSKRRYQGQRREMFKNVPHEKKLCTIPEEERTCDTCGNILSPVGEEFVRSEIEYTPAKIKVVDYYRETFECRNCRKNEQPYMKKPEVPCAVIQHSYASASTVSWVIHQKYELAVPLYRQEQEWASMGVPLKRSIMSNWIMAVYRDWLAPVEELLHRKLLEEKCLHADETPVQVLNEPGRKNTTQSYMWLYRTGKQSSKPVILFEYQPGRSGKYPESFLKGFQGYLHTDAYSGYGKVMSVKRCYCWTHLRRKFVEALPKELKNSEETLSAQGIRYINKLFEIESKLEGLSSEERKEQRLLQEKPVLDAFWLWVDTETGKTLPKSRIGEAFRYAANQKEGLMTYLENGDCALSNNLAENSIRPFTIGRKNWLFSGSPKGAKASAGVYSLIETAKANGLKPRKYIQFILSNLPATAFREHPELLEEFLPWSQNVQEKCH